MNYFLNFLTFLFLNLYYNFFIILCYYRKQEGVRYVVIEYYYFIIIIFKRKVFCDSSFSQRLLVQEDILPKIDDTRDVEKMSITRMQKDKQTTPLFKLICCK